MRIYTRSTKQLCEIIEVAKARRLKLIIGTFVVDCSGTLDPMTDGMLKMMGVFAEIVFDSLNSLRLAHGQ